MRRREFMNFVGSAAWPLVARAQQPVKMMKRIAMVHPSSKIEDLTIKGGRRFKAYFDELTRLGYVEGQNLAVERYSGEGRPERYAELARYVVSTNPDLIFAIAGPLALSFKTATATIPVVTVTADPIAIGLVPSIAHPGANITGVAIDGGLEILGKRIGLLIEATSKPYNAGYLASRLNWERPIGAVAREAGKLAGISLTGVLLASFNEGEYRRIFSALKEDRVDAIIVSEETEHITYRVLLVELVAKSLVPAVYPYREFAEVGGLISYSIDLADVYRRLANLTDKILKGANPADIPFYQETKFELIVNLKTAKALRLELPPMLLGRADEVIE
jgi:putative tryptophan/tyrosine transport system substrate-binding protein